MHTWETKIIIESSKKPIVVKLSMKIWRIFGYLSHISLNLSSASRSTRKYLYRYFCVGQHEICLFENRNSSMAVRQIVTIKFILNSTYFQSIHKYIVSNQINLKIFSMFDLFLCTLIWQFILKMTDTYRNVYIVYIMPRLHRDTSQI